MLSTKLRVAALTLLLLAPSFAARADDAKPGAAPAPLTVSLFADEIKARHHNNDELADRVRQWFGADNLKKGPNPKTDNLRIVAAIETASEPANGAEPVLVSDDGKYRLPLKRIGKTNVYAATDTLAYGTYLAFHYEIGADRKGGGNLETYTVPPEFTADPAVPHGVLTQMPDWHSTVFANTVRKWWVYVPAQVAATPDKPAAVTIIQDGEGYTRYFPTVVDNMIAKGEIPPMVVVFINPGNFDDPAQPGRSDRSFEYDTLSDQYPRFLLEEILPEVEKTVKLRHDAAGRCTAGISSGGICAFTAAWERPDQFSKVLSWVGSFVDLAAGPSGIAGGHNYPPMIRRSHDHPKPIRVFLEDGANDLDNPFGNWPLAAQEMVAALKWAGYDYKFVFGQGGHNDRNGRAVLPNSLRWLWRDWKDTEPKS